MPVIHTVTANRARLPVYDRLELSVSLEATYENPFDSREVAVDAAVRGPGGREWAVPGFLYQPFSRELVATDGGEAEVLTPAGDPSWRIRLSFPVPGDWHIGVSVRDRQGEVRADPVTVTVVDRTTAGMIRRHPEDHRYFADRNGRTVFLVGANVCWGGGRGTFSYDDWLPRYADADSNFFRVWLAPMWTTFALNTEQSGYDRIDLGNAWRLDYVLELAETLGLRVMTCIDSFNILRSATRTYGMFEQSPYHVGHGGPVSAPLDYFTSEVMRRAYRDRLRYLVARYGYSPALFAWEFWNEVDIIDGYRDDPVVPWHRDMARYLADIDPWDHLITTSTAGPRGKPKLDALPELEFVQTHHYQARDMAVDLWRDAQDKEAAADRPHFHGEFGISHSGRATGEMDPTGVHLHNGLFAAVVQGQAGTPMTWWWDSYVHPRGLYPVFAAVSRWRGDVDPAADRCRMVETTVTNAVPTAPQLGPVSFDLGRGTWQPAPFNRPLTVRVSADGTLNQPVRPSSILHGSGGGNQRFHNPVTFDLELPEDTRFTVQVEGVSGWGGAALRIAVDDTVVLERNFEDPDGTANKNTITTFNGEYTVDVPAGRRRILVDNTGPDWIMVSGYRVDRMVMPRLDGPLLRAYAMVGRTRGLLWIQNPAYTWPKAKVGALPEQAVTGASLRMAAVPPGRWHVTWVDTATGEPLTAVVTLVAQDQLLRLDLPPVHWDAAARLERR